MKLIKRNRSVDKQWRLKDILLKLFLVVSIVFSILVVSNCDLLTNFIDGIDNGGGGGVDPGNTSLGSTAITELFRGVAQGAGGKIGGTATGWAMGALGLVDDSPDFSNQLDKIDESLQEIISQLNAVQNQLNDINNQLLVLDCSAQQTAVSEQTGRIDYLTTLYKSYVATAAQGGRISNATLSNWVNQVLAEGQYTGQTPLGQILTTIANQLIQPSSGAITACVKAIQIPGDNTFGDKSYYNKVNQFTNYYYYYQAEGLSLLNEALHYRAWQTAAAEDDDNYSADSVAAVCSNADAKLFCIKAGTFTNTVYNALIDQFTAGGSPYEKDGLSILNKTENAYLWPLSLEDFQTAGNNPNNCNHPLTSANPCGKRILYSWYENDNYFYPMKQVNYEGYSGWVGSNMNLWAGVLSGWKSGTAGNYLENNFGFKNMKNKIILGITKTEISLDNSGGNQWVVPFLDTDLDYNFLTGGPVLTSSQFNKLVSKGARDGELCKFATYYRHYSYDPASGLPSNRDKFYDISAYARRCGSNYTTAFNYLEYPGWAALLNNGNNNNIISLRQFRWPMLPVSNISCTKNRSNKNAGGVWTICGNDFTDWFNEIVPRPETCDLNVGVICKIDNESISKAKKMHVVTKKAPF